MLPTASATIAAMAHLPRSVADLGEIYLGDGVPPAGGRFANPVLAAAYCRILAEAEAAGAGRDAQIEAARRTFYEGFVAEAIAAYLQRAEVMDVSGRPHRGLLAGQDLAAWRASVEAPVTLDYAGLTVCKTGPWGQGPVFLQQLALLSGFGLAEMGPGSADFIHTVVECTKLAFADREAWYGDPRWSDVPLTALLSPGYASQRRQLVASQASGSFAPGRPAGRPAAAGLRPGLLPDAAAGTHRQCGDRWPGQEGGRRTRPPRRGRGRADGRFGGSGGAVGVVPELGPAIRATWMSLTGSAIWSPRRRAAAGCKAPRSSRDWGSASAPGRRCSA
jgi:gamma-glutamyltranspeptidase/glutathione hydrolase